MTTATTTVPAVPPAIAAAAVAGGALFIDVRSQGYRELHGGLPQAQVVEKDRVAERFTVGGAGAVSGLESLTQPIVVICGSLAGSTPVVDELVTLGFTGVVHVEGAYPAWKEQGFATTSGTDDGPASA